MLCCAMAFEDVNSLAVVGTAAQVALVETVAYGGSGGNASGSCPFFASALGGAFGGVVGGAVGGVVGSIVGGVAKEVGVRCLKRRRTDTGDIDDDARRIDDIVKARMLDVQNAIQLQLFELQGSMQMKADSKLMEEMKKTFKKKIKKIDKTLLSQQQMLDCLQQKIDQIDNKQPCLQDKANNEQVENFQQLLQHNMEQTEITLQTLQQNLQGKADAKQLEDFEKSWTQQKFYQGKASFNQIQVVQRSLDEMAKKIEVIQHTMDLKAGVNQMHDVQEVLNQKVDHDDVDLMTDALKANVDRINNEVAAVKTQALDIEVLDRKLQELQAAMVVEKDKEVFPGNLQAMFFESRGPVPASQ